MTGTPNQIEWAEQIRPRVAAEFDRVAHELADRLKQGTNRRVRLSWVIEEEVR